MERAHSGKFAAYYNGGMIPLKQFVPLYQVRACMRLVVATWRASVDQSRRVPRCPASNFSSAASRFKACRR